MEPKRTKRRPSTAAAAGNSSQRLFRVHRDRLPSPTALYSPQFPRRVAAGLRQQDIANGSGISTTRYSAIERGQQKPTELERTLIEGALPDLPISTEAS